MKPALPSPCRPDGLPYESLDHIFQAVIAVRKVEIDKREEEWKRETASPRKAQAAKSPAEAWDLADAKNARSLAQPHSSPCCSAGSALALQVHLWTSTRLGLQRPQSVVSIGIFFRHRPGPF